MYCSSILIINTMHYLRYMPYGVMVIFRDLSYSINRFSFRFHILNNIQEYSFPFLFLPFLFCDLFVPILRAIKSGLSNIGPDRSFFHWNVPSVLGPILSDIRSGLYNICLSYRSLETPLFPIDLSSPYLPYACIYQCEY